MTEGDTGGSPIFLILLKPVPVATEGRGAETGPGQAGLLGQSPLCPVARLLSSCRSASQGTSVASLSTKQHLL